MLSTVTDQLLCAEAAAALQVNWLLQQASLKPVHSPDAWACLEAAHIVGQTRFNLHRRVHKQMLVRAWAEKKLGEVNAQLFRLALIPLGHLFKRLPLGNPGSSRVGAFTPMPVPMALAALIDQSRSFAASNSESTT